MKRRGQCCGVSVVLKHTRMMPNKILRSIAWAWGLMGNGAELLDTAPTAVGNAKMLGVSGAARAGL